MDDLYLYVDGESHFVRTSETWKLLYPNADINSIVTPASPSLPARILPIGGIENPRVRVHAAAHYFWDSQLLHWMQGRHPWPGNSPLRISSRAVYFTSFTGNDADLHAAKVFIREGGFEPQVIHEHKKLKDQRENLAVQTGSRRSAKGVDIGLAVRMLEDASRGNYSCCMLFTSDVDFIPAIEAVRRAGKQVFVFGYKSGLGVKSDFEFVPDKFIDIGETWMKNNYAFKSYSPHPRDPLPEPCSASESEAWLGTHGDGGPVDLEPTPTQTQEPEAPWSVNWER